MEKDNFIGKIDKLGVVWSKGFGAQQDVEVGLDIQAVNDIKKDRDECFAKAEKYLEELYVCGARQRPKTVEQITVEQSQINQQLFETLKEIKSDIKTIKDNKEVFKI